MNILEEMADNALINLQVFTGGTITNSYAESVNNQIRRYQLAFHLNSKDKIPILRHFCKYQVKPLRNSFVPKQDLLMIMQQDALSSISHGVLRTLQKND